MKVHSGSVHSEVSSPEVVPVPRKASFLKVPFPKSKHDLELPRFYSSDQKKPKKTLLSQQKEQEPNKQALSTNIRGSIMKKKSFKYAKTQKNETPTKSSIKTIRVAQSKWDQIYKKNQNSRKDLERQKSKRLKEQKQQIEEVQAYGGFLDRSTKDLNDKGNANKIRYKISQHKRQQSIHLKNQNHKHLPQSIETEPLKSQQSKAQTSREVKANTEADSRYENPSLSRSLAKQQSQFKEYLQEPGQNLKKKSESIRRRSIGDEEIKYLYTMLEVLKQSIKNPGNLDFPQVYIVSEKAKHEKVIFSFLQQKYQKGFKNHIILSRFLFYLSAHLILSSMNSKIILGCLNKLLESQLILIGMLGLAEKKHGHPKMTIHDGIIREKEMGLAIENRGGNIGRNNELVKNGLEGILAKTKMEHIQLFQSLLISSGKIDSFEFIAFLDKTLKWQVLKMPSYPFLPPCITTHTHHLILDLDETLIHFDPDRNTYHVRPHGEDFLRNLSALYQLTIFTAGTKEYADQIINEIDKGSYVKHRLYRNHLTFLGGESVKDLTMLGRDMKTTLIIDNLESNFKMHSENGILIKSWYHDSSDQILLKLESLLIKIAKEYGQDLRKGVKTYEKYIDREITEKQEKSEVKIKYKI